MLNNENEAVAQANVITNWNLKKQTVIKKPTGLKPEKIHNDERIAAIDVAADRYKEAGFFIPDEWVIERYLLVKRNAEIASL